VLMSVFRTLKLKKQDATKEIASTLRTHLHTGQLSLPPSELALAVAGR
jgi:hypothetical protein